MSIKALRWLHGLVGGTIGGGATLSSALGCSAASNLGSYGIVVNPLEGNQILSIFVMGAITSATLYLKKCPLPEISEDVPESLK